MGRAVTGFWWSPTTEGTPTLVVTAVFFAFGGLAGCLIALSVAGGGAEALQIYLESFLAAAQTGAMTTPSTVEVLWRTFRWFLAVFLLGFTALGIFGIPALVSARGFFLAFSVAAFAQAYGRRGLTIAFFLMGIPGLFSIPALFLLSAQSLHASWRLALRAPGQGRRELPYHRDYFLRCGFCAAAVCFGFLLERYLVPVLVTGAANVMLR